VATCVQAKTSPTGTVTGTLSQSGLKVGGLVTVVTLNAVTWTALPLTPLANRNAMAVQNDSATRVKLNYSSGVAGFVGMVVYPNGGERNYDITDAILLYGKCESGTVDVNVEQIA